MPDSAATPPKLRAPAGATDTHMHFYGPYERWPLAPTSPNNPPPALVEDYRKIQERLGLERVVVVQPGGYTTDNRCTMAAVAELGDAARAVVVVDPAAPESELQALADAGAVGLRVFMLKGGIYRFEQIPDLAAKVRPFGWHLQLQLDGRTLLDHEAMLAPLAAEQLVIDHTGKFLEPVTIDHPAFHCLRRLVDKGAYVKLSAPYETSKAGPPLYPDVGDLAKTLVRQAPERMLWATNWPHPAHAPKDEAMLLDYLLDWAPDEAHRRLILVENPARRYGFPPVTG
jgi:D-galactarolactone isomerase